MPGSNARALDKARQLPADALIFDLDHEHAIGLRKANFRVVRLGMTTNVIQRLLCNAKDDAFQHRG